MVAKRVFIVSGKRSNGEWVYWVNGPSVQYSVGFSLARKYEKASDTRHAFETAKEQYPGIAWQVESVNMAFFS